MYVLDRRDIEILTELQRDSRQSVQQLAGKVGLSATPCWKRVKDMEAAGVIRGYGASIDRESVGLQLCVLAEVNLSQHTEALVREFERAVAVCPQIISCYSTTGGADYSIKVLATDIKAYEAFLHDTAFRLPGVTHIRSSVVLKEIKADASLPIHATAAGSATTGKASRTIAAGVARGVDAALRDVDAAPTGLPRSDVGAAGDTAIGVAALVAAGIGPTQARQFGAPLQATFARFGIDTPLRQAAFVAQCAHESSLFTALEESLFYRKPERICAIFKSKVPNLAIAQTLACNPRGLANRVYANRNGNQDEASGDGWRYRGRGLIQLTGRTNYTRAAADLQRDYVGDPDLVLQPLDACLTAGWFWHTGKLNALADAKRIDDITRAINGPAMAGAKERRDLFETALAAFTPPAVKSRSAPASRTSARTRPSAAPAPARSGRAGPAGSAGSRRKQRA
jgi:predicted chitinase/DNA-binding Lrp family transcriptional regulator